MLTAAQAAAELGISRRLVYALAQRGELPSYRFGDALRFATSDLAAYKESCRSAGTPETSAGATSSTVSLQVAGTGLAAYFRKAGVKPRLTPSTAKSRAGSTRLELVSNKSG